MEVFNFAIINVSDGIQVIDRTVTTKSNTLNPIELLDYMELDAQLVFMDKLKRKARQEAERRKRVSYKLRHRIACLCRLL